MKTIINLDPLITLKDLEDSLRFPIVCRVTEFDDKGVKDFEEDFSAAHSSGQPIIPVVIDSYGGSCYGCLSMISTIRNSRLPVATIVTGKAMSAGAILFAFGTEGHRYMDANAIYMIHDLSVEIDGKIEDVKVDTRHNEHLNLKIFHLMAKQLNKPQDYFLDLLQKARHTDLFMTATEAKKHGIVNVLGVPSLEMNVKVEYKFGT